MLAFEILVIILMDKNKKSFFLRVTGSGQCEDAYNVWRNAYLSFILLMVS